MYQKDFNHNGTLSLDELEIMFHRAGHALPEKDLQELMELADTDVSTISLLVSFPFLSLIGLILNTDDPDFFADLSAESILG